MAYRINYREDIRLAKIELSGRIDADELTGAMHACYTQPAWEIGSNTVWDGRKISMLSLDISQVPGIQHVMAQVNQLAGPGKTAIVVSRDIDYAVAKLLGRVGGSSFREIKPFYAIEEAAAWLSLTVDELDSF